MRESAIGESRFLVSALGLFTKSSKNCYNERNNH